MLLVYYSGHADAAELHPGATLLALSLLERLVQGSPRGLSHSDSGCVSFGRADTGQGGACRASSQTFYEAQHPTFRLDLKGHGAIPITWMRRAAQGGRLTLPQGRGFLLFADSESRLEPAQLERVEYARLARKGGS